MEWIGTGFVLTLGGIRLRVRVALEDTPRDASPYGVDRQPGEDAPAARAARHRVHAPRR